MYFLLRLDVRALEEFDIPAARDQKQIYKLIRKRKNTHRHTKKREKERERERERERSSVKLEEKPRRRKSRRRGMKRNRRHEQVIRNAQVLTMRKKSEGTIAVHIR